MKFDVIIWGLLTDGFYIMQIVSIIKHIKC